MIQIWLFILLIGLGNALAQSGLVVDGFVDTNQCSNSLDAADGNKDDLVDAEEYVAFVRSLDSSGALADINEFIQLPLVLQATFLTLACMCSDSKFGGDPNDTDCCLGDNASLSTKVPRNAGERTKLFATCYLTDQGIIEAIGSRSPTALPTEAPTMTPTVPPSIIASEIPSITPTESPSSVPSTESPTLVPTERRTTDPTTTPTLVPTTVSEAPTTYTPTTSPTVSPTEIQPSAPALVEYQIATTNNSSSEDYTWDLVMAMDRLAPEVASEVFPSRVRRSLLVTVQVPTSIIEQQAIKCPVGVVKEDELCKLVVAEVVLLSLSPGHQQVQEYKSALQKAIRAGRLQDALYSVNDDSEVYILTGMERVIDDTGDDGWSNSAKAGIVVAALVAFVVPMGIYFAVRRSQPGKPGYDPYEPEEPSDLVEADEKHRIDLGPGTLGAQKPNYGITLKTTEHESNVDECVHISEDSSSNAGSSGWSSSAGLSSLNTGSHDDSFDAAMAAGASLAMIGAASGLTRRIDGSFDNNVPSQSSVSRQDLDSAIEAGDWAAVGTTAALLAAASDSNSAGSRTSGGKSAGTSVSSIDAARAAELDHLVDAGDWEGVVLAAAKFEASETTSGSVRSASASSAHSSINNASSNGSGIYPPSVSTTISESPSKAHKLAEVREEVESLVRRVVPEEIDNVDEMMLQFKGREEELVETLRTMQERAVAQRARAAGHKAAKQEARRSVRRGVVPGARPPVAPRSTTMSDRSRSSAGSGFASSGVASSAGMESELSVQQMRTALELAIEAGDWEAVGEAAAMMSDTSATSGSTSLHRRGMSQLSTASSTSTPRAVRLAGVNAERARELDDMIDRGDWSGVVAAAGRFSRADKESSQSDASVGEGSYRRSSSQSDQRKRRLREEADALAQAEIWMAIAEQSKNEGSTDVGARDAADWAIARSLSRLRQAEGASGAASSNIARSPQGSHQSQDDESV